MSDETHARLVQGLKEAAIRLAIHEERTARVSLTEALYPAWAEPYLDTAVLCYVGGGLWFTTKSLAKQWGDGWNDAPYEHNAGSPYRYWSGRGDEEPYDVFMLPYRSSLCTPDDVSGGNSTYSVQDINAGRTPWLRDHWGNSGDRIMAGTTLRQVEATLFSRGEALYWPMRRPVMRR